MQPQQLPHAQHPQQEQVGWVGFLCMTGLLECADDGGYDGDYERPGHGNLKAQADDEPGDRVPDRPLDHG
jgi:hypothetical protein